jgi:Na+/melibiose symporter-like transporter
MVFIPYQSWGAEISPNFEERTRVAGFREGGSFAGYLLGSLIPFVLLELILGIEAPSFGQMLDVLLWCFLLGLPLAVLVSFRVVGEKSGSIGGTINWRQLYSIPVRNRPFLRLMTAYLLDRTSMGIYLAANPYVITYLLGLFDDFLIIALLMSVVAVAFCPFWVVVARRLGKHTTYCIANGITVAGYALFLFVPTSSLAWTLPIFVVLGIGNAGTLILPPSMTADAVDYDQLRTGVAQTGGHMAFLNLITKVGLALGIGVTSAVLWLFGFDESAAVQDEASLTGLRATIGLVPSLFILPAIWLMATFPLDSRRHGIIRRRLAGRAGHSHSGY